MVTASTKARIAWVAVPHLSGMTTIFHLISAGLRRRGWECMWVGAGEQMARMADEAFARCSWDMLCPDSRDVRECATAFVGWVEQREVDMVITVGEAFVHAAAASLPSHVRLILKCSVMSRHAYAAVTANIPRTDLIIVETQRQYDDLTRNWRVPREKCALIPNGVDVELFAPPAQRDLSHPLRIIYSGRLDEVQKNVLLLPHIAARLVRAGIQFELSVLGDGPDRERLRNAFLKQGLDRRVKFHGPVPREEVVRFLQEADVLILPSRFEGMSWVLLEAMACGCVAVVSDIRRTMDMVVRDGANGLLCRVGDAGAFARAIMTLARDRVRLQRMSLAARKTIEEHFTMDRMIEAHDRVFTELLHRPRENYQPAPLSEIKVPKFARRSWRAFVPRPVKNLVRTWAERFHITV